MTLSPVPLGFGAYSIAAILSGLYVLGREKADTSPKTLGVYAFIAFLSLFLTSLIFIISAPLGDADPAPSIQLLFALLTFSFSSVWLGFSIALFYNWDLKFVGDAAFVLMLFNIIGFFAVFKWMDVFGNIGFTFLQINMILYILVEYGFWALTHGKISSSVQGALLIISGLASFLIIFYTGGIITSL